MIKHVSFDVWNTLIKANPEFSLHRTKAIALMLNLDTEYVKQTYTQVKGVVDKLAEIEGRAFTTPEVYRLLFRALGISVSFRLEKELREHVNELFLRYPPIIEDSVRSCLAELNQRGITMSLSSNSNFISGDVMLPFLLQQFEYAFNGSVFSDLCGASKPAPEFFDHVIDYVTHQHVGQDIKPWNILHVGDNVVCDREGPRNQMIHSLIVAGPHELKEAVLSRVASENDHGISYDIHLMYNHAIKPWKG